MGKQLNIAVCDDDANVRATVRSLLKGIPTDDRISVREYTNGRELTFELSDASVHPDILYLDINMPELDGMQAAHRLRDELGYQGAIVFLTVDKSKVFEAFDVDAVYYLIKGELTQSVFDHVYLKAHDYLDYRAEKSSIIFTCAGEDRVVPVEDIHWFEVNRRIVTVHYGEGEEFEFYSSMALLSEQLEDKGFARCHKSYIVALNDIASFSAREIETFEGDLVPVGGAYATMVRETLANAGRAVGKTV